MVAVSEMDRFKKVFYEECSDLLASVEENLRKLNENVDIELIHAIFRAIHSIKGGAGSFELHRVIKFAHAYETLLDLLREQKLTIDSSLIEILFKSYDVLTDLVNAAKDETYLDDAFGLDTLERLLLIINNDSSAFEVPIQHAELTSSANDHKESVIYTIEFSPHENLLHYGSDPILIFKELKKLSLDPNECKIELDSSHIPDLNDLLPNNIYMNWKINIKTYDNKKAIYDVFEFVSDLCDLKITSDEDMHLQTQSNIDFISEKSSNPHALEDESVKQPTQEATGATSNSKNETVHSLRVEIDRIDKLVNTVGEIVIKQAMILNQTKDLDDTRHLSIINGLHELAQYTRELQENVMAIRAQPIKSVFNRMPRLVRDLASQLNKNVILETFGEDTEIDKTVIENLSEPLIHMIRNAIDHGIEGVEERIAENKPKTGKIILSAEHKNGRICIQIKDDGRGINRERVRLKAIDKGLIGPDATLTGEEIDNIILMPGFSTAENITNISGRGVGLDVVRKIMQSLGGRLHIQSQEGKGCSITLTLPLTLAVLDGMIVCCEGNMYIVPLVNIVETISPNKEQIIDLAGNGQLLKLRDRIIPLFSLREVFNLKSDLDNMAPRIIVVIETDKGELAGIIVDDLQGKQQVVIKSLETNYEAITGISAATIMGDGSVATILDVNAICDFKKIRH
jgi:two-component system chemotaxis sensor kinase CheA